MDNAQIQSPPRNNKGFTSWDTEWETNLIVDFLKTNRSIIRLWNIEKLAELPENSLDNLLRNNYKSIKQEKIDKLLPVLGMIGFKLKPRPNDDFFYVPIEKFKCELAPAITIEKIQKIVCKYYNVSVELLSTDTRKGEVVKCRQIIWHFAKIYLRFSSSVNGLNTGLRKYSDVLHGLKIVSQQIETNKKYALEIDELDKQITR